MLRTELQVALITSANMRAERHGETPVAACDIGISFETGAGVLDYFSKGLRDALYTDQDPASQQQSIPGTEADDRPSDGPFLRFNGTLGPLKIKKEWLGYSAHIEWGDLASSIQIDLESVKVTKITAEPKDGGTCIVSCQLQAHPAKEAYGDLASLIQREVRVTLIPPSAEAMETLQREAGASQEPNDGA